MAHPFPSSPQNSAVSFKGVDDRGHGKEDEALEVMEREPRGDGVESRTTKVRFRFACVFPWLGVLPIVSQLVLLSLVFYQLMIQQMHGDLPIPVTKYALSTLYVCPCPFFATL